MQIKDYYLISKKQSNDEQENINLLTKQLEKWFENVCSVIISRLDNNFNEILYLFQVEEIIKDHKQEYMDILSENIHDYYINTSETAEAKINNKVAQKTLDNTLLYYVATKDQSNLDEWLDYSYQSDKILKENIKKRLRYNTNTKNSLDRYLKPHYDLTNFTPSDISIYELLDFEIDKAVVDYMSNNIFIASESTLERVTQEIYDIIKETYAEQGEGINRLTEAIQEQFNELSRYESERIARTETLKAQGSANHNRLINNPSVDYIQWISTDDERTRESHIELNGEITFADGSGLYSNGLKHPGDTDGAIEEWINCRCDEIAFIPDAGFVPPPNATSWFEDEMIFDDSFNIPEVSVELDEYLASWW